MLKLMGDIYLSIVCFNKYDKYKDYWRLRSLYRKKKKGFICDVLLEKQDGIFNKEMGIERISLEMPSGYEGIFCLYNVDRFISRYMAEGVKYDLLGYRGMIPIRSCTMREFITLYGKIL